MKKILSPFKNDNAFQYNSVHAIIFDIEQNIIDVNKSALKLLKYNKNEVIGKNVTTFSDNQEFTFLKLKYLKFLKNYKINHSTKDKVLVCRYVKKL